MPSPSNAHQTPSIPDPHDAVPYPGTAYPATHPDNLAVQALLHGLTPTPVAHCRVLEIGCNEGRNLIPMAYAIPTSHFVGFDLAAQPVARGNQRIQQLGLTNIHLFQADILTLQDTHPDLGLFDYIIAHGVYAWVPQHVADALLALCRRLLTPNGVAFISYNALPGGHLRTMIREILQHQPGPGPAPDQDPTQSLTHSLDYLKFIASTRPEGDPYRTLFERELTRLPEKGAQVVFHDELTASYNPVSFTTFVTHAAAHSLQFLADATLPLPNDPCFNPAIAGPAKTFANGDPIAEEQSLDHARMRMYRETLLCHQGHDITWDLRLDALAHLRLSSRAELQPPAASDEDDDAEYDDGSRNYKLPDALHKGAGMDTRSPALILIMDHLIAAWPESVPMAQIERLLAGQGITFTAELVTLLLRLIFARMIHLHTWAAPVSATLAARPLVSHISRFELTQHDRLINLAHSVITLPDPIVRTLLQLLDGTRDRAALLEALHTTHPDIPLETLAQGLEPALHLLNRAAVILAS
ncbi:methyltransferase regulatory domain-containing protein [Granulicella tundricola]|uniref:Methyltransferase regulatory domain, predicted n=1 Tax=Granulicella tundricola (strain ATCC BAA-1859 / DSM 23138 / MP5ACTX9) TaxID=1198114 RepID=E8X346_GRATM|nr:methyltransferase regulatory domain-containing protein [Granulicella tundricola]ADW69270.1 Methyltransferase regulatory domain, predicted [Granulicella tundricola MP5ACTX9]